jgi:hypothetical protein
MDGMREANSNNKTEEREKEKDERKVEKKTTFSAARNG